MIRADFFHTLMIIYLRDIGPAGLGDWIKINKLIQRLFFFRKERILRKDDVITFYSLRDIERKIITEIIYIYCNSQHTQEYLYISHLNKLQSSKTYLNFIIKNYPDIYCKYKIEAGIPETKIIVSKYQKEVDDIIFWLEKRSRLVYKAIDTFLKLEKRDMSRFIFIILHKYTSNKLDLYPEFPELFDISVRWYNELYKERYLVYYHLIYYILYPEFYIIKDYNNVNIDALSDEYYYQNIYGRLILFDDFDTKPINEWACTDKRLKDYYEYTKLKLW